MDKKIREIWSSLESIRKISREPFEFKDFPKEDIFPSKKSNAKQFLEEWKAEYENGSKNLQKLGEENEMFKRIFQELRKQKFTDIMRLYLKRYNVPLTTILNYFE